MLQGMRKQHVTKSSIPVFRTIVLACQNKILSSTSIANLTNSLTLIVCATVICWHLRAAYIYIPVSPQPKIPSLIDTYFTHSVGFTRTNLACTGRSNTFSTILCPFLFPEKIYKTVSLLIRQHSNLQIPPPPAIGMDILGFTWNRRCSPF